MGDIQMRDLSDNSFGITSSHEAASTGPKAAPGVSIESLSPQDHVNHMPKTIFKKSFTQGLLSRSWIIHVVAVGATIGAVQLSFNRFYWFDEQTSAISWRQYSIDEQTNKKALQFVAKLHEALIVSSLSAMVLHVVRRMLIGTGPGLSFGLLAGAYRLGSIPWLFSASFWTPLRLSTHYQNFFFAVCLGFAFIYANLVGPSSAIVIIPTLAWWPVADPYQGKSLTTYVAAPRDSVFPTSLNYTEDYAICTIADTLLCPGGGLSDLRALLSAYEMSGVEPETQVRHPVAETYRILKSTLDYAGGNDNGMAVAVSTTQHSSISALVGGFWNHIKKNESSFINRIKRPRFQPSKVDVFAPLVQVQCTRFSRRDADKELSVPAFSSTGMRNFSGLLVDNDDGKIDHYRDRSGWDLDKDYWMKRDDPYETTFEWLDLASMFPKERPSLGAIATVPVAIEETLDNRTKIVYQDSYIIPCMIDSRWAGASVTFDPASDISLGLVLSNLTDLSKLEPFWNPESNKPVPGGLAARNVPISLRWAELLNLNDTLDTEAGNITAVEELLGIFVHSGISAIYDEPITYFQTPWDNKTGSSFRDPSYNVSEFEWELNDIARTIATILSLVVADGMSRVSYTSTVGMILEENDNGTVLSKDLYFQTGQERLEPENIPRSDLEGWQLIQWEVSRYGWGYGLKGVPVWFGIVTLLIHVCMVIVYAAYMVWFRTRPAKEGWASTAWDTLQELLAFALISPPPEGNIEKMRNVANGEADDAALAKPVKVSALDGEDLVLVI